MNPRYLGKIVKAEFGINPEEPHRVGLKVELRLQGSTDTVVDEQVSVVFHNDRRLEANSHTSEISQRTLKTVAQILNDARVSSVSELVGKPVEIEVDGNEYKSFSILKDMI